MLWEIASVSIILTPPIALLWAIRLCLWSSASEFSDQQTKKDGLNDAGI